VENFLKEIVTRHPQYKRTLGHYKRFSIPNLKEFEVDRYYNLERMPSIRLPYPNICIEYKDLLNGAIPSKFIIFLKERYIEEYESHVISIIAMFSEETHWNMVIPFHVLSAYWYKEILPEGGYSFILKFDEDDPRRENKDGDSGNTIYFVKRIYDFLNLYYEKGIKITGMNKRKSLGLSFKNYDEYRILELDKPANTYVRKNSGGTHASPREHERSGHWRNQRYKDGFKPIFIEKTIVNKGIGNKIEKDYLINTNIGDHTDEEAIPNRPSREHSETPLIFPDR